MTDAALVHTQPYVHANGAAIPCLGLGTWQSSGDEGARAVEAALRTGYRHVDTAAAYRNEEQVGAALRASGVPRGEIFLTTKVWYDRIGKDDVQRAAEASLKRLGLEYIDLLLIHWPNPDYTLADTMAGLSAVRREGLARNIGVSNFTVALMDEAVRHAAEPLATNQCEYHPYLDQTPVINACRAYGMAFTSYSPIGRGALLQDATIVRIAEQHGRTPAQIVLRWHIQQPGVVAVPKSVTPARIAENLAVFDFELGPAEMDAIFALRRRDGRTISPSWAPTWDT
ncbi:aldo/keto reductase [Chelatococcus reniformis]|uniref:2,5-didehydrogluconate reductase n=1 Tax=Chelatococcus reniformis TaxID=1494448 RepID=A0A916U3C3_9HYPH|nr:aldo/keto reductase [Chelatococcus reniformis]GGC57786.1 2,5-didehydrogluconate reductase [Chelatococcus reniformis]